jgi:hypothetical protein
MKMFSRRGGGMGLGSLVLLGMAAYGGYTGWQNFKSPYKLVDNNGSYSLLEKDTNRKQEITKDFQLGTLEYRLHGISRESAGKVKNILDNITNNYQK